MTATGHDGGSDGVPRWEVRSNRANSTVDAKSTFKLVISDFCSHDICLPNAARLATKTSKYDDVTLRPWAWSTSTGQDGCNAPDNQDASLPRHLHKEWFLDTVSLRSQDWNSSNVCIGFCIHGHDFDFNYDDIPVPRAAALLQLGQGLLSRTSHQLVNSADLTRLFSTTTLMQF